MPKFTMTERDALESLVAVYCRMLPRPSLKSIAVEVTAGLRGTFSDSRHKTVTDSDVSAIEHDLGFPRTTKMRRILKAAEVTQALSLAKGGMSSTEIARRFGCSPAQVRGRLAKEAKPYDMPFDLKAIEEAGRNLDEMAERSGYSQHDMSRELRMMALQEKYRAEDGRPSMFAEQRTLPGMVDAQRTKLMIGATKAAEGLLELSQVFQDMADEAEDVGGQNGNGIDGTGGKG